MSEVKPIKSQIAKIERKIKCPRCKSFEFNYVEYKNGQKLIVSPCGWELCYIEGPRDDMDIEEPDYSDGNFE
jgi:hypothetical protein